MAGSLLCSCSRPVHLKNSKLIKGLSFFRNSQAVAKQRLPFLPTSVKTPFASILEMNLVAFCRQTLLADLSSKKMRSVMDPFRSDYGYKWSLSCSGLQASLVIFSQVEDV
jgi:hypothetical protein